MSLSIQIEQFIERVIAGLGAIEEALREHNRAVDSAQIRQEDARAEIRRNVSIVSPDDEYKGGATTYKHKSYRQQVALNILTGLLVLFTLGAFLVAGIYACIANRQLRKMDDTYGEIREQTTLLRRQLEGTQAAIVNIGDSKTMDDDGTLYLFFKNTGRSLAHNVDVNLTLSRRRIPDGRIIGIPVTWHIPIGDFPVTPDLTKGVPNVHPPILPIKEMDEIRATRETVRIEGVITYDDGFAPPERRQPICLSYLAYVLKSKSGVEKGSSAQFDSCDDFATQVPETLKAMKDAANKE